VTVKTAILVPASPSVRVTSLMEREAASSLAMVPVTAVVVPTT
jgi:hypothetical protein